MSSTSPSAPGVRQADFQFRCIACGELSGSARQDFRCTGCGDLLEITYPAWKQSKPDPDELKSTWRNRKLSRSPIDLSGVWRFRDLLPALEDDQQAITLREGNTPLYELPQCARITGVPRMLAKHQGMNPSGSFKDTGMTVAATFARRAGFRWVACASTGKHFGLHGGLRSTRRNAQPGAGSRRQDFLEQALAGPRLWRGHLPVAHRL